MWFRLVQPLLASGPEHTPPSPRTGGSVPRAGESTTPSNVGQPGRLNVLLSWGGWRTDSWADRVACLLEPMGVQSHKAATARQAEHVIRSVPVHIAVVDLGLPLDEHQAADECGARVLELLRRLHNPPPTVIVSSPSTLRGQSRDMAAALRADAFAVVDRRSADVECMLKVLQRAMERFYRGQWPSGTTGGCASRSGSNFEDPTDSRGPRPLRGM